MRTKRPYGDPWPAKKVLRCIEEYSGAEFDGAMAHGFTAMLERWEPQQMYLDADESTATYPAIPNSNCLGS